MTNKDEKMKEEKIEELKFKDGSRLILNPGIGYQGHVGFNAYQLVEDFIENWARYSTMATPSLLFLLDAFEETENIVNQFPGLDEKDRTPVGLLKLILNSDECNHLFQEEYKKQKKISDLEGK